MAERCQQRPICRRQLPTGDLALKDAQLMPQQQDLDLLLLIRTESQHDKLGQPPQRPVRKQEDRPENDPPPPLTLRITRSRGGTAQPERVLV
jgi:hypothetical protein